MSEAPQECAGCVTGSSGPLPFELDRLLAALPVGVVVHAGDGRILRCNSAAEQVLGMSESQMKGLTSTDALWRTVHEDGTDFVGGTHPATVVRETGVPVVGVVMGVHKPDGTLSWISVNATPIATDPSDSDPAVLATFADVTEHVRLRAEARAAEARYRLLAQNATDVVIHVRDGINVWVSPSLRTVMGWEPEEWVGHPAGEFAHPDDVQGVRDGNTAAGRGPVTHRARARTKDGSYIWMEGRIGPFVDGDGVVDGTIVSLRDVHAEVGARQALHEMATHDGLTGLLSRGEVLDRLEAILSHPPRSGGRVAVAFCDLDDFKSINDRHGHGAGDEALRIVAARVRSVVRENDLVARFGGDEILVVLDAVRDAHDAQAVADKIGATALLPIPVLGGAFTVTLSIGIALAASGDTPDALIARADDAMYAAKSAGKNCVVQSPAARD